jgi:membrane protein
MKRALKRIGSIVAEAVQHFGENHVPRLAAALAFYTVISLTPLLLVVVGVAGQIYGEEAARGELVEQIEGAIGTEAAVLVENALSGAEAAGRGVMATIIGIIALIIGATTLFANLKGALNSIWGVEERTQTGGLIGAVREFLVTRLLVFLIVIGVGVLVLLSLVATTVIEAAATFFDDQLPLPPGTLRLINTVASLGIMTVLFAYVYRAVPDVRVQWRHVWFGAIVTAVLFTVGKHFIGLYLGRGTVGTAYGAAGALVVLLVWVYYSSMIFFFGAQLTKVYASRHGSRWRARRGFRLSMGRPVARGHDGDSKPEPSSGQPGH